MGKPQLLQASHPDSRNMRLAPKEHWPIDAVVIKSMKTPAMIIVRWSPCETALNTPWVVAFYLEWGPDWNCRWSRRFSTIELRNAFALSGAPDTDFVQYAYSRSGGVVTLPTTERISIENGDQVCQVHLRDEMREALQRLVDEKLPKIAPDATNT